MVHCAAYRRTWCCHGFLSCSVRVTIIYIASVYNVYIFYSAFVKDSRLNASMDVVERHGVTWKEKLQRDRQTVVVVRLGLKVHQDA